MSSRCGNEVGRTFSDDRQRQFDQFMAAPTNIRQINRHDIVTTLMRAGTATRSSLARATGLSQPTAGKIVDELIAEGVLQTVAASPSLETRMGRPGHDLRLSAANSCFIAIQLGAVHTRLAKLSAAPPADDIWDRTLKTPRSFKAWTNAVTVAAKEMVTPSTKAVLISLPGVLNEATGESLLSPNLRWLEGQGVAKVLQDSLGLPAFAVQEIRCLALGHGAIEPADDNFLLVDFGTGVGSAAVVGGRLLEGQLPLSGELGHTPVPGNAMPCGCGGRGCLETVIGRDHLMEMLGIPPQDWLAGWTNAMAAYRNKPLPAKLRRALDAAALGIAGALNVLGLNRVIITGYLAHLPEHAIQHVRQSIQASAVAGRFGEVHTTVATRRRLAGLARVGINRVLAPV